MTTQRNDLDPARAPVWITFAWIVLAITLLCVLTLLSGCGGGIDTPDEVIVECSLQQAQQQGFVTCSSRPKEHP